MILWFEESSQNGRLCIVSWASQEVKCGGFEDPRLDLRLVRMVEAMSNRPSCTPPEAFRDEAGLKGAYRFWNNPRVSPRGILAGHVDQTVQRAGKYPVVLAIQDTTEIDVTSRPSVRGVGYLASPKGRGLLLHSVFAVSPTGLPLGTIRQIVWSRPLKDLGKRHQRRKTPLKDKESRRWLHGLTAAAVALQNHPHTVVIGDRESDFFPLFAAPRRKNVDLLVRVTRETRRVEHPSKYLGQALQQSPVQGAIEISLPRSGSHSARTAKLAVRWLSVEVHPPVNGPRGPSVKLQFLLVEEIDPPPGIRPIRWLLATTLPIENLEQALQYVQWYAFRWRIEQFHYVFKSGCRIEELQLESADSIRRAIATHAIVAWRVLWLALQARETPDAPCTVVLQQHEWQVLHAKLHPHKPIPADPPTLREAVRMIANLGGFLGRKGDGEPGPKTLWRGIRRLDDLATAWRLARLHSRDPC
jgi:hypothetical protein